MENRKIVRRTYNVINGKKCDKVMYAIAPKDMYGGECFDVDIEKAHLFRNDIWLTSSFCDCTVNGNARYGKFSYKQEILTIELVLKS